MRSLIGVVLLTTCAVAFGGRGGHKAIIKRQSSQTPCRLQVPASCVRERDLHKQCMQNAMANEGVTFTPEDVHACFEQSET